MNNFWYIFPTKNYFFFSSNFFIFVFLGFHRALADVGFMVKIFLESPLEIWFSEIEISTFKKR